MEVSEEAAIEYGSQDVNNTTLLSDVSIPHIIGLIVII